MAFEVDGVWYPDDTLPERFRELAPLISRWCLAGDVRRGELQEAASTEELMALIQHVDDCAEEMRDYYTAQPSTTAAYLLMILDECAEEASMVVGLREETKDFPE
jgi:hypothetical protein